ncbi:hypothetical protein [Pseudoalteromonas sp. NBT06-2]|uniref:hypothetical protein n=1 Tax=Pseudoalteromonas sp. NBT06-2 TaxID=2025950 RepID=UPI001481D325|nr:hypothetical protein [Pseudoalteromonas sp. NBT06-2]
MRQFQQRSEHLAQAYKDRLLMRTIRKGTKGMREAGEQFLPRSMAEQPYETEHGKYDPYQARLKRSVFANFTKDAIKKLCAKPFSTTMTAETKSKRKAATDLMEQIKTNIDGSGTSLHNLFRKIKIEGAWNGICHGFVDADSNAKPYARVVHPDTILDAQELNGELVILTFSEDRKEMAEDGLSIKTVKRERTYRKFNGVVEWALFEEGEDHHPKQISEWTIFGGGNINEIPLFTYYADVDEKVPNSCLVNHRFKIWPTLIICTIKKRATYHKLNISQIFLFCLQKVSIQINRSKLAVTI